jgi:RimJ/RimL family protein N-acetyltransferase
MTRREVKLRIARRDELGYLSELGQDPLVEPLLSPGATSPGRLEELLARTSEDCGPAGVFVIESPAGEPVGGLALQVSSPRSRICELSRLMVDPRVRGAGIGAHAVILACQQVLVEHRFHRLQAETYGDNFSAQRLFERVGFVREGVRRRAYWRREQWLDGVLYGILAEELGEIRERDG